MRSDKSSIIRCGTKCEISPSPIVPYIAETVSMKGSSTIAAVAAAQKAERAEVNGRMAELRVP